MRLDLEGTVALVTGAAGAIGQVICSTLNQEGATVIAADIVSAPACGGDWWELDVTSERAWADVIGRLRMHFGRLDILVNSVGVCPISKLETTTLHDWRHCHEINLDGTFLGMKTATALPRESGALRRGGASVINIASAAADRPTAFSAAYSTSKAAVAMLTKAAAIEFGTLGYPIRVNSIHPGAVLSPMMEKNWETFSQIGGGEPIETLRRATAAAHPMGRFVEPEEIADSVAFLASGAARHVHGIALHVDGGYSAA